jgi:flagellar motor switch protein FliN/FliY
MAEQQKDRKIAMIHDVGMQVSVELGRTDKFFKDILQMKPGSVVELNTRTGDRIDFLVNKRLVARGEVMVIDGKYALRITDIVGSLKQAVQEGLEDWS